MRLVCTSPINVRNPINIFGGDSQNLVKINKKLIKNGAIVKRHELSTPDKILLSSHSWKMHESALVMKRNSLNPTSTLPFCPDFNEKFSIPKPIFIVDRHEGVVNAVHLLNHRVVYKRVVGVHCAQVD